ncbi:MAG: Fe-S cluster assembly protein SufD [Candidatus Binatia bacterium]|nr:Fe-S cluster assembly protein SufD [Candidatus Binatia bacterium]
MPPAHGFTLYEEAMQQLEVASPSWLRALRAHALEAFRRMGFPTARVEDWKYTDVSPIAREPFSLPPPPSPDLLAETSRDRFGINASATLRFLLGQATHEGVQGCELPNTVRVHPLRVALTAEEALVRRSLGSSIASDEAPFAALNTALVQDGGFVHVPAGTRVAAPIQLLFVNTTVARPTILCPRNLIVLEDGAAATVVEFWAGHSPVAVFTNAVTEIVLGRGATLTHLRIVEERDGLMHMGTTAVRQAADSVYRSRVFTFGGRWARVEIQTRLEDAGAATYLDGLFIADGPTLVDHHTAIDHVSGRTTSRQLYKGVLDGSAHGVFNGKVFVRPGALKSDAQQMNKNLLLSDDAEIDTKPQLEIFADDVKCSHGAAIGRLDESALFYLQSRGIAAEDARRLLIYAFANEIVERVELEPARATLQGILRRRLAAAPEENAA